MDESVVQDMMMLADTDRDDKVSLDEFKMIMRAGPKSKPSSRPSVPSSGGVGKNGVRRRRRSRSDVFAGEAAGGGRDSVNDPSSGVTHFLLLLNRRTFVGERGKRLAHTLRAALGLPDPDELITLTAEQERASSRRARTLNKSWIASSFSRPRWRPPTSTAPPRPPQIASCVRALLRCAPTSRAARCPNWGLRARVARARRDSSRARSRQTGADAPRDAAATSWPARLVRPLASSCCWCTPSTRRRTAASSTTSSQ